MAALLSHSSNLVRAGLPRTGKAGGMAAARGLVHGPRGAIGTRAEEGFTLVEVLVALMVMALLAVMAWQGVDGILRTRQASQVRLDQMLRLNTAMAQFEQDLLELQDTQVVPALAFDGATFRLTRRGERGLQLVAWSLRDGGWWRWSGSAVSGTRELQDQWLVSQQLQGREPGWLRVLDGVSTWQVYCYRNNGWSNCQSSGDVASPTAAAAAAAAASAPTVRARVALPTGVRLTMTLLTSATLTRDILLAPHLP